MNFKVEHCHPSVVHYFESQKRAEDWADANHGDAKAIDCKTKKIVKNLCALNFKKKK